MTSDGIEPAYRPCTVIILAISFDTIHEWTPSVRARSSTDEIAGLPELFWTNHGRVVVCRITFLLLSSGKRV